MAFISKIDEVSMDIDNDDSTGSSASTAVPKRVGNSDSIEQKQREAKRIQREERISRMSTKLKPMMAPTKPTQNTRTDTYLNYELLPAVDNAIHAVGMDRKYRTRDVVKLENEYKQSVVENYKVGDIEQGDLNNVSSLLDTAVDNSRVSRTRTNTKESLNKVQDHLKEETANPTLALTRQLRHLSSLYT